MTDSNTATKDLFTQRGYVDEPVARNSSDLNVAVYITDRSAPKWAFGYDWHLVSEKPIVPTYTSQDDMRFASPRYYGVAETTVIAEAVAGRQPLPEPPLPLD
jgi:hypothetical protein